MDYRSSPHSTTGVSPFELMFKRGMRTQLTQLTPTGAGEGRERDEDKVKKGQEKIRSQSTGGRRLQVKIGDQVRIRKKDGSYSNPKEVQEVYHRSVRLKNGQKWAFNRISPVK